MTVSVDGAFSDEEENVINWRGDNFYRACDAFVVDLPSGGAEYCVKRVNHPGNTHEAYSGAQRVEI